MPPAVLWGVFSRALGGVYLVAFLSIWSQVRPIAGARGLFPIAELLDAIRRDFRAPARWLYFPTFLWFRSTDRWLIGIPTLGVLASLVVIVGGPHAPLALIACWSLYLSLDLPMGLVYPWDSALLECGFWAMFLPGTAALPSIAALAPPRPELVWVFRLLLVRLMFGFGKQKFVGTTREDLGFLHGFFIRQPLPTPLGWHAHRAPMWFHKTALLLMFIAEVVLPVGGLWPGAPSIVFGAATTALMIAIGLTGNYGFFNVLTIVLSLVCFDNDTPRRLSVVDLIALSSPSEVAWHGLVALYAIGSIVCLPLNTWASLTWTVWPWWHRVLPRGLRWPIGVFRVLQPFRWLHSYGVFPPRSAPAVRMSPTLEATWDGHHWRELTPRIWPTREGSPPRFIAPHHPRFDHAIVYEAAGFHESSLLRNLSGRFNPYGHRHGSGAVTLVRQLLEGKLDASFFFEERIDPTAPPVAARISIDMLSPVSSDDHARTGLWWHRERVGPHLPAVRRGHAMLATDIPYPELWHPNDWVWLHRSRLGRVIRAVGRGADPHESVLLYADGITTADVDRFWNEFIPWLTRSGASSLDDVAALVNEARERWGRAQLVCFERLVGRYSAFLVERCEPHFGRGGLFAILRRRAQSAVRSCWHLALLARQILLSGRDAYDRVASTPERARDHAEVFTLDRGLFLDVLFRFESYVQQSQKLRMLGAQVDVRNWPAPPERTRRMREAMIEVATRLWGIPEAGPFLHDRFTDVRELEDSPERWPTFRLEGDLSLSVVRGSSTEP